MFMAFIEAQRLNRLSGGTVIAPWDIERGFALEEWLDAANALTEDLPVVQERKLQHERIFNKRRRAHKYYSRTHFRKH